jgi:hypothetical protein
MCGPDGIRGFAKKVAGVNTLMAGGEGSSGGIGTFAGVPTARGSTRLQRKTSTASFAALFGPQS